MSNVYETYTEMNEQGDKMVVGETCLGNVSFCTIQCKGARACYEAKFKPLSETVFIHCEGEQACKGANVRKIGVDMDKWRIYCSGHEVCQVF